MAKKRFPNGFDNWYETHHEVVSFMERECRRSEDCEVVKVLYTQGTGGIYELAKEWTDEFEKLNKGREWDGEFFDEIEKFCNNKNHSQ
jgi:hypothetical protein